MRTLSGIILGLAVLVAVGCGESNSAAPAPKAPPADPGPQPAPAKTDPQPDNPNPPTDPKKETGPSPPPAAVAAWELDPAKHAFPDKPAAGQLGGKPFVPIAEMQGEALTFRTATADGNTERELVVKLSPELVKKAADGLKLVVKPDQPSGPEVPEVESDVPDRKPFPRVAFAGGYALTLELGKKADGKVPGKVFLALPVINAGDEKVFLAGTFTADWVRPLGRPPGADEAPFVQGSLSVPAGVEVRVGYAGLVGGKLIHDSLTLTFPETGAATRSIHNKPRASLLEATNKTTGRYDHTRLDPGRFLMYAGPVGGPLTWKWVTVEPTGQLTIDFALDPSKSGGLEVTVPAGTPGPVAVAPAEEGKPWDANLPAVAHALGLQAEPKDNKATFAKLGPGRYEVRAADLSATVEVKAGETAKVELKK
jgi:hypothetical protein